MFRDLRRRETVASVEPTHPFDSWDDQDRDFYYQFVAPWCDMEGGGGFKTPENQEKFAKTRFLCAGVGAVGGNMFRGLARCGAIEFDVADPDTVDTRNLGLQCFDAGDIGVNKAEVRCQQIQRMNPLTEATPHSEGITMENVAELVKNADIVIDGIDIAALDIIYELHKNAAKYRKPVLVGYDIGGTSLVVVYRYDLQKQEPLNGELTQEDIVKYRRARSFFESGKISKTEYLDIIYQIFTGPVPLGAVPVEYLQETLNRDEDQENTLQYPVASMQLASQAPEIVFRILNGEEVKGSVHNNVPDQVRKKKHPFYLKPYLLLQTLKVLKEREKRVNLNQL